MSGGRDDFVRPDESRWFPPEAPFTIHSDKRGLRGADDGERDNAPYPSSVSDLINNPGAYISSSESGVQSMEAKLNENRDLGRDDESDAELDEESRAEAEDYAAALYRESLPIDAETDYPWGTEGEGVVVEMDEEDAEAFDREPEEVTGAKPVASGSSVVPPPPSPPEALAASAGPDLRSSEAVEAQDVAQNVSGPENAADAEIIEADLAQPVDGEPVPQETIEEAAARMEYEEDDPEDERRLAIEGKRCTAVAKDGRRCRSYALKEGTVCSGHAGYGLAADPLTAAALSAEARSRTKIIRQIVAPDGRRGPRAMLRLAAMEKEGALAARIMASALDPESGVAGANLALRVIDGIDPLIEVSTSLTSIGDVGRRLQSGAVVPFLELRSAVEAAQLESPAEVISA